MLQENLRILTDENVSKTVTDQLRAKGVDANRLIDHMPEGTPDPDVLEFAHENGFALLTHDESITKHITDRVNEGKDYTGVIIAPNHLQGPKGIGKIVTKIVELDTEIKQGSKTVEDTVYNQLKYIQ